jgi:hypothetical protein
VWFSNRRAKWRREDKIREEKRANTDCDSSATMVINNTTSQLIMPSVTSLDYLQEVNVSQYYRPTNNGENFSAPPLNYSYPISTGRVDCFRDRQCRIGYGLTSKFLRRVPICTNTIVILCCRLHCFSFECT